MKKYDAIIIGSGQGGTPLAKKLAQKGWKTALVEKEHIGGTCVNTGCTPTKTMIASAKAIYNINNAARLGIQTSKAVADMPAIIRRKNEVVASFRDGSEKGLSKTENLEVITGIARFTAPKTIGVILSDGELELTADKILIDCGSRPRIPNIEGLKDVGYFTSNNLMDYAEVPQHLLIIGGGYVALEFGQMYRRFGSKVTILEHGKQFLSHEDRDIADAIKKILEDEGITIYTNAVAKKVAKANNEIQATVEIDAISQTIMCSHLLVATGRQPNADKMNLAVAGVELTDRGYIKVNQFLQTTAPDIYALGDVKGAPEFTHISYDDHRILFHNLFNQEQRSIKQRPVPYTMFTDPQLGRIGMTEQQAREKGLPVKVAVMQMEQVARAIEVGDTRGMMKAVVDANTHQIIGAAILGAEGGEIMTVLQMAMMGGIPWQQIKDMVIAHPLYAESLNNLFMLLDSN